MNKFFLIIFVLFLALPAFAGNVLQQEYEMTIMNELSGNSSLYSMSKKGLIQDDYLHYLNGGGSLYGVAKYKQEELQKTVPAQNIKLRYLNLILNKYDLAIKNKNPHLNQSYRIIVEDVDYNKLDDELKRLIGLFNLLIN